LKKDRFAEATFKGEKLELPVAPIDTGPAGAVRLEAIADFRKPLLKK